MWQFIFHHNSALVDDALSLSRATAMTNRWDKHLGDSQVLAYVTTVHESVPQSEQNATDWYEHFSTLHCGWKLPQRHLVDWVRLVNLAFEHPCMRFDECFLTKERKFRILAMFWNKSQQLLFSMLSLLSSITLNIITCLSFIISTKKQSLMLIVHGELCWIALLSKRPIHSNILVLPRFLMFETFPYT